MTLEEILTKSGLEEDKAKEVLQTMKDNSLFVVGEENLDVRYKKLKEDHEGLTGKYSEAETLIKSLQETAGNDESLKAKINEYEVAIAEKDKALTDLKINNAIETALLKNKAIDTDYLTFKLREGGELELDDKGEVKGLADKLTELKTKFPTQFESAANPNGKDVDEQRLPEGDPGSDPVPTTLASAIEANYTRKE